jgi:hypothetical protein
VAKESVFVETAHRLIEDELKGQPLIVKRGAALLYQIRVDNNLRVMSEIRIREPKRGDSAFQTDLCIFEKKSDDVLLPRIVLEFKTTITTHDVLTYSTKAERHKAIYPYLRYGLVASSEERIPGRFFTHNEGIDFCFCSKGLTDVSCAAEFASILKEELECSRLLEKVVFGEAKARVFRADVSLRDRL